VAKPVNIGVIGTSWWTEMMFLSILQADERVNLQALCGRNQERAIGVAQKFGIGEVYRDYREMFAKSKLDAVVIASTDETHYEMAMAAFEAGLHVLCEKPVALNSVHVLEMLNKAEEKGLKHLVMYTHHWFPYFQRAKQLITENYTGKIFHGYFHWCGGAALNGKYDWRFDANRTQGITADLGSHIIHAAIWLLGEVKSVVAQLGYHVPREDTPKPAHDTAQFLMEFKNGAQIEVHLSAVSQVFDSHLKLSFNLQGEKGAIEGQWLVSFGETFSSITSLRGQQLDSETKINEAGVADFGAYFRENPVGVRLFVDSILHDTLASPNLKEGYQVQRIIDAVIESHERGCRVVIGD
jgi:predicted dehydrogenase